MMVSSLYFQAALINAIVFLWLASAALSVRMLMRVSKRVSLALSVGVLCGPVGLIVATFLHRRQGTEFMRPRHQLISFRSFLSVTLVTLLSALAFYFCFVYKGTAFVVSSETLLQYVTLFVAISGIVGGIILAAFTLRVAFFESCWSACLLALLALTLTDWIQETFYYGSSSVYFSVLIATSIAVYLLFLTLGGAVGYLIFGEGRFNLHFGYENFIGTRFLMTKRSSQVVSLISVISVIAVMIACAGMIVVMSVMNGFTSEFRSKILGANAHLMVLKYGNDFSEFDKVIEKTKDIPGVSGASSFIVNEGMVSSKKNISGSIITGIDLERVKDTDRLQFVSQQSFDYLRNPESIPVVTPIDSLAHSDPLETDSAQGKNELPGVIIGKELANELQVFVGDVVSLISPVGEMGPTGPIPKARPFRVAGLFYSGMYDFDAKFSYIALSDAQEFFRLGNTVTGVEYRVDDIENTRAIAKSIDSAVGGYPFYTRDWMQMNKNMFSALQLEKIAMLIILGTLIFMASLLILVTLIMVVMEKGKEIAILKSMGATDVSIMKIFVTYGLFVGGFGALFGGGLGFVVCFFIEKIGIRLDPDVYYFSNLPVEIINSEVFSVVGAAVLISFLATIPPALFAARLKPVEGLRYE